MAVFAFSDSFTYSSVNRWKWGVLNWCRLWQNCIGNIEIYHYIEDYAHLSENSIKCWSADVLVSAPSTHIQCVLYKIAFVYNVIYLTGRFSKKKITCIESFFNFLSNCIYYNFEQCLDVLLFGDKAEGCPKYFVNLWKYNWAPSMKNALVCYVILDRFWKNENILKAFSIAFLIVYITILSNVFMFCYLEI
jgi:hypothetical protein